MLEFEIGALGEIVLRTLAVYLVLMIALRLAGKRELGEMSVFDLVVILVIASAVQNAMIGANTTLVGGLVAAMTLLGANTLINSLVARTNWLKGPLWGTPTMLVNHGQLINEHMRSEGLTLDELLMAMREHGVEQLSDVKMAVLEVDGTISIIPSDATHYRTRNRVKRSLM